MLARGLPWQARYPHYSAKRLIFTSRPLPLHPGGTLAHLPTDYLLRSVDFDHLACLQLGTQRILGFLPCLMRKQKCEPHSQTTNRPALHFELQDCFGQHRSQLKLPHVTSGTAPRLTECHSNAVFSTQPRSGVLKVSKHSWHGQQQQPCFASLLQSFDKSKPANKSQPVEAKNDASAKLQTAAGWSKHLLCGALSAVVSRTTMAPLERIKLEIVLHKRQETMFEVALGVLERDGKSGFWKGNGINLLRTAPYKVSPIVISLFSAMELWQQFTRLCSSEFALQLKGTHRCNSAVYCMSAGCQLLLV